jgi:uncharacterized membrane protein
MSVRDTQTPTPAPPTVTPYPGLWQVALGAVLAVLAPLAGFLGGTLAGPGQDAVNVDSLLAWLIGGLGVGGVGVLIALLGGLRLHRATRGG